MKTFDDEFRERYTRLHNVLLEWTSFEVGKDHGLSELLEMIAKKRRHIHVYGNGGSYAQAEHFVAELLGRFEGGNLVRHPASVLGDATILTALHNDLEACWKGPACILDARGETGDLLVVLSTSGTSKSVVELCRLAMAKGIHSILLTGEHTPYDDDTRAQADFELEVPSTNTATIQEVHQVMLHALAAVIKGASCEPS